MIPSQSRLWAKRDRENGTWHSLVAHCSDVAAVFRSMMLIPSIRSRMNRLAGVNISAADLDRLTFLAFIHDIGKANSGFQSTSSNPSHRAGHIRELKWLIEDRYDLGCRACDVLEPILAWFASDGSLDIFESVFAHHGRPWTTLPGDGRWWWQDRGGNSPLSAFEAIIERGLQLFPEATTDAPPLPVPPRFVHVFAGLLMLADWIGSDVRYFPMSNGDDDDTRYATSLAVANGVLSNIGFDSGLYRDAFPDRSFEGVFGVTPRPFQQGAIEAEGQIVLVEAETGAGKTEAALGRFLKLFANGDVDSLYFALPTRVAATQIFNRVRGMVAAAFGQDRPSVVLAVPGQEKVDGISGSPQPNFDFVWDDGQQDDQRWSAEKPKRFLASTISVGTIDQFLLAAIKSKHAHMRHASAIKSLVVIDEVHASDIYMQGLLATALDNHVAAGGHALLLSATLGSAMRATLLGGAVPPLQDAIQVPYPGISTALSYMHAPDHGSRGKEVRVDLRHHIGDPAAVAQVALDAAKSGAKVLIIRNTVAEAVKVQDALLLMPRADEVVWKVNGRPAMHHGRFSVNDRKILDEQVCLALGKGRPSGGLVVIGTQTLEQSLDIDADLLITDLCPMDVLLQRIGRLHRHKNARPAGYEYARVVVLCPTESQTSSLATKASFGLGMSRGVGVYSDLTAILGTLDVLKSRQTIKIPAMNRELVESALHPEAQSDIRSRYTSSDWLSHFDDVDGIRISDGRFASLAVLSFDRRLNETEFTSDEIFTSRLGGKDRVVTIPDDLVGPFGVPCGDIKVPEYMARGWPNDFEPTIRVDGDRILIIAPGGNLSYGLRGLGSD